MTNWQRVWRTGFVEQLPTAGLEQLRMALMQDDPRLLQGATIFPSASELTADDRVECACVVGYCLWKGLRLRSVAELNEEFVAVCNGADERLGEVAGCRVFFNWYDEAPRRQMRFEMLQEVNRVLHERHETAA